MKHKVFLNGSKPLESAGVDDMKTKICRCIAMCTEESAIRLEEKYGIYHPDVAMGALLLALPARLKALQDVIKAEKEKNQKLLDRITNLQHKYSLLLLKEKPC